MCGDTSIMQPCSKVNAPPPRCRVQVPQLLAAMPSLAQLGVVNQWTHRGVCSEAVWWAWWLKGLLPESVHAVWFDFESDNTGFFEEAVRSEGESLEQMLGRLALAAGAVAEAAGPGGWREC